MALLVTLSAVAPAATAAAPTTPTSIFSEHCIRWLQHGRTIAAADLLARKAGYEKRGQTQTSWTYRTPAGDLIFREQLDGTRACEIYLPLGADYPALAAEAGDWVKTLPDGPYVVTRAPGPDIEGERVVSWQGRRYSLEINEWFYDDDQIHLLLAGKTPEVKK